MPSIRSGRVKAYIILASIFLMPVLVFFISAERRHASKAVDIVQAEIKESSRSAPIGAVKKEYIARHIVFEGLGSKDGLIYGNVKNTGGDSIGVLKIAVHFLDGSGKRADTKNFIIVSVLSLFNPTGPLPAKGLKYFEYDVYDYAHPGWSGHIDAEVVSLTFEDELKKEFGIKGPDDKKSDQ